MKSLSVLSMASVNDVEHDPFAHLVVDNCLDTEDYRQLAANFPDPVRFQAPGLVLQANQAVRIPASTVISSEEFSAPWRDFFRHHTSQDFWDEIVEVMGDAIRKRHPDLEQKSGRRLEDWRAKLRGSPGVADIELDCLFVINTPAQKLTSVRPAHVDFEEKVFAGLLYLREAEDPTSGGDLALYKFRAQPAFGGHYARLNDLHETHRIAYGSNRFVAFVNGEDSIHGVTPRAPSDRVRRYINFIACSPHASFRLPRLGPLARWRFSRERKRTKSPGITLDS
ncbi:MAG: hypothetical protein V3W41_08300 [Planctomycetota bacterium]